MRPNLSPYLFRTVPYRIVPFFVFVNREFGPDEKHNNIKKLTVFRFIFLRPVSYLNSPIKLYRETRRTEIKIISVFFFKSANRTFLLNKKGFSYFYKKGVSRTELILESIFIFRSANLTLLN